MSKYQDVYINLGSSHRLRSHVVSTDLDPKAEEYDSYSLTEFKSFFQPDLGGGLDPGIHVVIHQRGISLRGLQHVGKTCKELDELAEGNLDKR